MLRREVKDGWILLTNTRTGKEVARVQVDDEKIVSSMSRYADVVRERSHQVALQQSWESKVLPTLWSVPVAY